MQKWVGQTDFLLCFITVFTLSVCCVGKEISYCIVILRQFIGKYFSKVSSVLYYNCSLWGCVFENANLKSDEQKFETIGRKQNQIFVSSFIFQFIYIF